MAFGQNQVIHAAFLDLSKAYDRVLMPSLLHKLSAVGLSNDALTWLSSFLNGRQQCVQLGGQRFSWQTTKPRIPQGNVLGPTLFLIYINDLPDCIKNDRSIFADDSTVYAIGLPNNKESTALSLSANLSKAAWWAKTLGMLFSDEKSEVLTIAGKTKDHPETDVNMERISMDGVLVPVCQKHKHLGVQINNRLSLSDHVDELYTACARKIGMLRYLRKRVSSKCLTKIYIWYIHPRLEYTCAIWSGGSTSKVP